MRSGAAKIKRDNLYRIDQAQEIADVLTRRAMESVAAHMDTSRLDDDDIIVSVFNPTILPRNEVMELQIDLPRDDYARSWWLETPEGHRLDVFPLDKTQTHLAMITPECRARPVYAEAHQGGGCRP